MNTEHLNATPELSSCKTNNWAEQNLFLRALSKSVFFNVMHPPFFIPPLLLLQSSSHPLSFITEHRLTAHQHYCCSRTLAMIELMIQVMEAGVSLLQPLFYSSVRLVMNLQFVVFLWIRNFTSQRVSSLNVTTTHESSNDS